MIAEATSSIGIVVIGRNEGERLVRCLESALGCGCAVVYVDSGSSDGSVAKAAALGARVVELDRSLPMSAARARNEGFRRLCEDEPALRYVQFVDGDCELVGGWLSDAALFLDGRTDVAAVCGRRKERHPERTVYNLLCDIEWNTPIGEARAFGGDAMLRVTPLVASSGYRTSLIAGEDPELGFRLRAAGWRIWRLDRDMTVHDAAMTRFGQWWSRTKRAGYAFAEVASLHGAAPERFWVRECRSALVWGLAIPLVALGAAAWVGAWAALLLLAYPLQVLRLFLQRNGPRPHSFWRAVFIVLGKFPEMLGQARFFSDRCFGRRSQLIEYKGVGR